MYGGRHSVSSDPLAAPNCTYNIQTLSRESREVPEKNYEKPQTGQPILWPRKDLGSVSSQVSGSSRQHRGGQSVLDRSQQLVQNGGGTGIVTRGFLQLHLESNLYFL